MNWHVSVFAKGVYEQAKEQGFRITRKDAKIVDRWLSAYHILRLNVFLSEYESKKIIARILNRAMRKYIKKTKDGRR
jgi:hypothetical protein